MCCRFLPFKKAVVGLLWQQQAAHVRLEVQGSGSKNVSLSGTRDPRVCSWRRLGCLFVRRSSWLSGFDSSIVTLKPEP